MGRTLFTTGHARATQDGLIAMLIDAQVECRVNVRAIAAAQPDPA